MHLRGPTSLVALTSPVRAGRRLDLRAMLGVIGAGAMGSALTCQLARAGHDVTILATPYDGPFLDAFRNGTPHPALGVTMPACEIIEPDGWDEALPKAEVLVLAVSTAGLVSTVRQAGHHTAKDVLWAIATKGWDGDTLRSAASVVADEVGDPDRVIALVGPSIAAEIAQGVPTGIVSACTSLSSARRVAELFESPSFRVFLSDDVAGVEVGAAVKNVIAIGIGLCDGLAGEFGVEAMTNTKAYVFSRGLVEMSRLARALGGRAETVLGLAGAGDLFVTALAGRNGRFGRLVGTGMSPDEALAEMNTTVEGYANGQAAVRLADSHGLDLPVIAGIADVLYHGVPARVAIERLTAGAIEEEL